eukprot:2235113-Pyramimonas_sp.AAC.1
MRNHEYLARSATHTTYDNPQSTIHIQRYSYGGSPGLEVAEVLQIVEGSLGSPETLMHSSPGGAKFC